MTLRKRIEEYKSECKNDIEKWTCDEILENAAGDSDEEINDWLKDLLNQGCASGMVGELITYEDTHKFYSKFYYEIEEIRIEWEEEIGEAINVGNQDLKNFYAWFAFEYTARKIADALEISD